MTDDKLERVLLSRAVVTETEFTHRIMMPHDISDEMADEISIWLEENCKGRFSVRNIRHTYSFRFTNNDDFMLFSMRWL